VAKDLKDILKLWKIKAEHDIKAAEKELFSIDPLTDIVCFHAQQAAEKYLKYFLVSKGEVPSKTHNLKELLIKCISFDEEFKQLDYIIFMTEYAVEMRYPDDFYIPTIKEANEAYKAALNVSKFVLSKISI